MRMRGGTTSRARPAVREVDCRHSRNGKYGISTHAQIGLLRLYVDVGSLDHFRPLLALDLYQRRKLLRCRADGVEAKRRQALGRVGQRDDPYDLAMERGDDLPGCAGPSTPTQPSPSTSG